MTPKQGDWFCNMHAESDLNEHGQERITPAHSCWFVCDVTTYPRGETVVSLVCPSTGGWINPTMREIRHPSKFYRANRWQICIANCERYSTELDVLELAPNGDDFNALMQFLAGAKYTPPTKAGR